MTELLPFQRTASNVLKVVLQKYSAGILRADEGLGKTHIAASIAKGFKRVLWVTKGDQKSLKVFEGKLYFAAGKDHNITVINYHTFGNVKKFPISLLNTFDLVIFDEAHTLRNYTASYTYRFVMNMSPKSFKFLFLTATPCITSPKNYIYMMNKAGLFNDLKGGGAGLQNVYRRFLDYDEVRTSKGKMVDVYKTNNLRHAEDFCSRRDLITYDIKQEEADNDMPPPLYELKVLDGKYGKPPRFEEETKYRVDAGKRKIDQVVKDIKDNNRQGLILCHFHETVKELAEKLGLPYAVGRKSVQKGFEDIRSGKEHSLVTTTGLTSSDLDLNECNWVGIVESTYSAPLDRQSIRRCLRIGKRETLKITYYAFNDERPLLKTMSRGDFFNIDDYADNYRPSSYSRLEKCPGSFWYPPKKIDWVESHAFFGTQMHAALERYLKNENIPVSEGIPEYINEVIAHCRGLKRNAKQYGIEEKVYLKGYNDKACGSCDFWAYDGHTLYVVDYKNGNRDVKVQGNFQLLSYATMICLTKDIKPANIILTIYQKDKQKTCLMAYQDVEDTKNRILRMIDKIIKAKDDPKKHLNTQKCCFFCPAEGDHKYEEKLQEKDVKRLLEAFV